MRALWLVLLPLATDIALARLPGTPLPVLVTKVRLEANTPVLAPSAVVASPGRKPIRTTVSGSFQVVTDPKGAEGQGNFGGACLFAQSGPVHECKEQTDCMGPALGIGSDEGFCVGRWRTDLGVRPGQCWFRPGPALLSKGQAVCNKGKPLTPGYKGTMSAPMHAFGPQPHRWRVIACQSIKNMENPKLKNGKLVPACSLGLGGLTHSTYVYSEVLEVP